MARRAAASIPMAETSHKDPVAVGAQFVVLNNGKKLIQLRIDVEVGYHIYDYVNVGDAYLPVVIDIKLPQGYKQVGEMERPFGGYYNQNGTTIFKDSVLFTLEVEGSGAGEAIIELSYQCCDAHICFPPKEHQIRVNLN